MRKLIAAACAFLLAAGCAAPDAAISGPSGRTTDAPALTAAPTPSPVVPSPSQPPTPSLSPEATRAAAIEAYIGALTTREKIASLFWVTPEALGGTTYAFTEETARALETWPVSGVVLFRGNIRDKEQVQALSAAFRAAGGPGFAVGVDEEGGRVSRLGGVSGFPRTPAMGRLTDGEAVYAALLAVGVHLKDWGFTLDFAPVCDVLAPSGNAAIGDRSFGSDSETVSALAAEAARGLLDGGVQPCLKHFPGHGGARGDSHDGAATASHTLERLRAEEWPPFSACLEAGARIVMAGHIALPEAAGDNTPGSLSRTIVTGFLREELGFQGLVVTDSMQMTAVTGRWDAGQAAVDALLAGCDVILMPEDLTAAMEGVGDAVRAGLITEARLEESIRRRLEIFF